MNSDKNTNGVDFSQMVKSLVKAGSAILANLTTDTVNLLHMAVGISGEAGELLEAVKKVAIYDRKIDAENIIEELGDIEFYLEGFRQVVGITREDCIAANIEKLSKRYKLGTYSNEAAQERADKK